MIFVYLRCGKCGKYQAPPRETPSEPPPGANWARAQDNQGRPYYVELPTAWTVIRLNEVEVALCGDCTPGIRQQLKML